MTKVIETDQKIIPPARLIQQAGFEIDTPIKVRIMDGCLVLTTQQDQQ